MRERNRRAREYSRLCRTRRWCRRLWAVAIVLWVMLLAFLAWCLTLPEVEDMDAALALKGREVSVRREDAALPEGEYFDAELMGAAVLDDATGEELGTIRRVLHYPAHKVYEVRGQREYLIPAVPEVFIASVDADAGVVRIHMMKGLATDEN